MSGPIARRPGGLLDLLLTQQQGRNPSELGDLVQPTLDMTQFYETDRVDTESLTVTVTATNQSDTATIPQGEVWKLLGYGARGTFATVNQRLSVTFRLSSLPGGALVDMGSLSFAPVGATDKFADGVTLGSPIILPPGTRISMVTLNLDLDAQANIGLSGALVFVRMNV